MNHIYLIRLVVLKRPGFQSQKYGMPTIKTNSKTIPSKVWQLAPAGSSMASPKFWGDKILGSKTFDLR